MPPRYLHPLIIRYVRGPNHPSKLRLLNALSGWLRQIECEVEPGLRLSLDYGDWLQGDLLCGRGHEPLTLALFQRLLAPGDTFVDVGANIGLFSLLAARRVGPTGRVIALEPNPTALQRLHENLALNPMLCVETISAAASDHTGEVRLAQPEAANLGGVRIAEDGNVRVRCAPLGELLAPLRLERAPAMMKIDVEGHEPAVLRGCFASMRDRPRHLLFEFKPSFFPVADAEAALWAPLRAAGYEMRTVGGQPLGGAVPEDNVWARHTSAA